MKTKNYILLLPAVMLMSFSCSDSDDSSNEYTNPVVSRSLPDPTLIRADDGLFYLYATEDIAHIPVMRSPNLVDWELIGTAFSRESRPDFVAGGNLWAPCINKIGDRYVLYYSMSTWGGVNESGVGAAWADNPAGPFRDVGKLLDKNNSGVTNSIDPCYIEDGGKHYIIWGSFYGLYAIEVSADGLSIKEGAEKVQVAGTAYEAAYVYKRGEYYYLFASIGSCCEGVHSTYTTVVGRSKSLLGPYQNKEGLRMLDNKHEVLIARNDSFAGPGHNAEIITDDNGTDWILYHAVDVSKASGRQLMLDRVNWVNDWPVVNDGTPSHISPAPVFR